MNKNVPILIIGAGSIGERHIRNLWQLGYHNLIVFRQRNLPFRDIGQAQVRTELNWDNVFDLKPFAALICTPTAQHMEQIIHCLQAKMHVFVEKPLSHNLEKIEDLKKLVLNTNKLVQVGFMMRFHPHILTVKNHLEANTFGKLSNSDSYWGSYLPDWHAWENYKESYAAKKSLGGGVALTLCHDIDLALWLSHYSAINYKSEFFNSEALDIETEAIANIQIKFKNNVTSNIHLNYLDNPPIRKYHWEFEEADIEMDYFENSLTIKSKMDNLLISKIVLQDFDRNDLFIAELVSFFHQIDTENNFINTSTGQITESELIIKICTK